MPGHRGAGRIVVGVDGSEPSIAALRRAAEIAVALDKPLEVIITWVYPEYFMPFFVSEVPLEAAATTTLDLSVEQAFAGKTPANLIRTVIHGPPPQVLIEKSRDAFLLAVGARGHGSFARLLLGSVSSACVSHADCPVLVMRTPRGD